MLNKYDYRANSRFAHSQWETALLYKDVSHWLGTSLESALWLTLVQSMNLLQTMLYTGVNIHTCETEQ